MLQMYAMPERLKGQTHRSWVWDYMGFVDGEVRYGRLFLA
jgi:hypothetical protein